MATFIRSEYIFGPIISRRLGRSLGVNITPINGKICNFDCIYCECGWNADARNNNKFPTSAEIKTALKDTLQNMKENHQEFDVITFSGNGEPTLNPEFNQIIDDTIELRDKFFPNVKISVLSNATKLNNDNVFEALLKIENPILKIDSANIETLIKINKPTNKNFSIENVVRGMQRFNGNFIMQTIFLRGKLNGENIDNTTDEELLGLIDIIKQTRPRQIMIYPIDRETPAQDLIKLDKKEMQRLAKIISQEQFDVLASGI